MEKQSVGKILLGKWDTKTIVGVAIGVALFGVLMDYASIKVFTNTNLTLAMIERFFGIWLALFGLLLCFRNLTTILLKETNRR